MTTPLKNGWVLDSTSAEVFVQVNNGGKVSVDGFVTSHPGTSWPRLGVDWYVNNCGAIFYAGSMIGTGPVGVPPFEVSMRQRIAENAMRWKMIVPIAAALVCGSLLAAHAQEKPATAAAPISAKDLTREQFQALPPDAVIEINGERITKSEFQARNIRGLQEAAKQLQEMRARAGAAFEARRKALIDKRKAAVAEANKKVEDELNRLVAADVALHGPNWEARKNQAAELFHRAESATPTERSTLEKQAADLLAPSAK